MQEDSILINQGLDAELSSLSILRINFFGIYLNIILPIPDCSLNHLIILTGPSVRYVSPVLFPGVRVSKREPDHSQRSSTDVNS
jgi:hypothetical protein